MFITLDSFNMSAKNSASASMQPSLIEIATPLQSSLVHSNTLLLFSWHKKFQPPFALAVRIVLLHHKHLKISYVLQTATRSCKLSHKMVKIKLQRAFKTKSTLLCVAEKILANVFMDILRLQSVSVLRRFCEHSLKERIVQFQTRSKYTPKGLLFINQWGPLRYAANSAFICLMAADLNLNNTKNR